jgi:phage terminase large subunit-like protein
MATASLNIISALDDEKLFEPWFRGPTWDNWRTVLKAAYALPLNEAELDFFHTVAGDRDPPTQQVRELWIIAGRRAGKDSIASAIAAYSAALFNCQDRLRPGERALVMCLACDRDQSRIVLNYTRSFFSDVDLLKGTVRRETTLGLELGHGVDVAVTTNSFRSVRGRPVVCAIFDEVAFWYDERSTKPDEETLKAVTPALAGIPGSMVVGISSPYRKCGL